VTRLPATPPPDADVAVRMCEPLCQQLAAPFFAPGLDRDDLLQAARTGAWKAWRDWRPDGGSAFRTFAGLCIQRELITTVMTARRLKSRVVSDAVRFEAPLAAGSDVTIGDVVGGSTDPTYECVAARQDLRHALWMLERHLSVLERDVVLGLVFAGETYRELADRLGIREKSGDNAMQRVKDKRAGVIDVPARRRGGVYVARQDAVTPTGLGYVLAEDAIAVARGRLGEDYLDATVVSCVRCVLGPDGRERRDARGRPRADGRRPLAVWRIVLEASDLPMRRLAA